MQSKDIALIGVASLSFLLSLFTLFWTVLRMACLSFIIHERIQGHISGKEFGLLIGFTIRKALRLP